MITSRRGLRILVLAASGVTLCALALTIPASVAAGAPAGGVTITEAPSLLCSSPIGHVGSFVGDPAIVPRNDCTPSFTAHDAIEYVQSHPFPNKGMDAVGRLTLTKVAFIPVGELSSVLRLDSIGLPNDAIVCYVEEYGSVTSAAPGSDHSTHAITVFVIFDGRSGNLLASG